MKRDDSVLKYDSTASKYETHVPDAKEVIRQTLFDTGTYLAAGQTEILFFQTPKGQGGKTFADTNMEIAGSLPAGKSFLIEGIGIQAFPTANPSSALVVSQFLNDIYTLSKAGNLQLFISSKNYLDESPLSKFPSKNGIVCNPAVALVSAAPAAINSDYATMGGEIYTLSPADLMIVPTTNFNVALRWPTAIPLPSAQNMRLVVSLYGVLYRWVQ